MAYDTATGIYDHTHPQSTHPLATVMLHDKERYDEYSGINRAIERYDIQGIRERFGLSFLEWISLPRSYIEKMSRRATKVAVQGTKDIDDTEREIQDALGGGHKKS